MNTINFAKNLKKLREDKNVTKTELARRVGVSDVTIGYWETGKTEPRMGKIEMIANVLGVTTDDLLFENQQNKSESESKSLTDNGYSTQVPLYGSIAAGLPLEMIEAQEYVEVPKYVSERYPNSFLLKVVGDSMNKVIPSGAYALIDPCEEVANGEVAVVTVNGHEATLKRFYKLQSTLVLEPDSYNSEHSSQIFDMNKDDINTVKVIGKLVWFMAPFNAKY